MEHKRKLIFLITAIILLLIFVLLTASSIVLGEEGAHKVFLPILFGDGRSAEQTLTPTATEWTPSPTNNPSTPTMIPTDIPPP